MELLVGPPLTCNVNVLDFVGDDGDGDGNYRVGSVCDQTGHGDVVDVNA